uniref:Neural cell adhesion molecule 1a n=1 Tax=Astyanax mexicanus TaxID=7994 RepID=A0A8B9RF99_ASTMX
IYKCVAKNGDKETQATVTVKIYQKLTFQNAPSPQEFNEGADVNIVCDVISSPPPTIIWKYQRTKIQPEKDGKSNYSLRKRGMKLCHQSTAQKKVPLVLPTIRTRYTKLNATADIGEAVTLACSADGYPEPIVTWAHKFKALLFFYYYLFTHSFSFVLLPLFLFSPQSLDGNVVVRSDARVSSLTLKYVQFTDAGQYLCTARNSIGEDIQGMYLEVRYAPKIQGAVTVYTWEGNAANISCEVLAHPGAAVQWFRDGQQLPGVNTTNIKIYNTPTVSYLEVHPAKLRRVYVLIYLYVCLYCSCTVVQWSLALCLESVDGSPRGGLETTALVSPREPNPPKIEGKLQSTGNELKVNWIKQDDGGSPIKHYLVRFRAKHRSEWKPEIRLPNGSEYVVLRGLDWNTEYEVYVVAENQQGRSQPGILSFRTSPEPSAIPVMGGSGLGTGAIVGILIVVFILLLFGVDVTCYFLNKCGLLMCIAVNFCGKTGPSAKGKDVEEGKAAFVKDESKEPIVEVRTEEERTPNHEGGGPTEPNETTPLTDPEHAADTTATVVDMLPSLVTTNSETVTDSPASESTTLTSSTAPSTAAEPKAAPQSSTPKASVTSPTSPPAAVAPLVDLSDGPSSHTAKPSEAPKPAPSSDPSVQSTGANSPPAATDSQQVDGGARQSSNTDPAQDAFDSLRTPSTDSTTTAPPAPSQDDGKIIADDKSKSEETEVKKPPAEVKTVPNEAPQTNGNESKA